MAAKKSSKAKKSKKSLATRQAAMFLKLARRIKFLEKRVVTAEAKPMTKKEKAAAKKLEAETRKARDLAWAQSEGHGSLSEQKRAAKEKAENEALGIF
jgi:Ulp1 family protease